MPGLNIATILSYVLAVAVGVLIYFVYAKLNISKANVSAQKIIDDATSKADNLVKEAILDAKTQAYELKLEAEKEIKEQKQKLLNLKIIFQNVKKVLNEEILLFKVKKTFLNKELNN